MEVTGYLPTSVELFRYFNFYASYWPNIRSRSKSYFLRVVGEMAKRRDAVGPLSAAVEPMDTGGRLCYVIMYNGFEHPWILVPMGGPGTNPLWIPRDDYTIA